MRFPLFRKQQRTDYCDENWGIVTFERRPDCVNWAFTATATTLWLINRLLSLYSPPSSYSLPLSFCLPLCVFAHSNVCWLVAFQRCTYYVNCMEAIRENNMLWVNSIDHSNWSQSSVPPLYLSFFPPLCFPWLSLSLSVQPWISLFIFFFLSKNCICSWPYHLLLPSLLSYFSPHVFTSFPLFLNFFSTYSFLPIFLTLLSSILGLKTLRSLFSQNMMFQNINCESLVILTVSACASLPAGLPGDSGGLGFELQQPSGHPLGDHCPAGQRQHPQSRP